MTGQLGPQNLGGWSKVGVDLSKTGIWYQLYENVNYTLQPYTSVSFHSDFSLFFIYLFFQFSY